MKEVLGSSRHNGLLEFFNQMVAKKALSQQDQEDYAAGRKVFYSTDLYVRKYIGQSLAGVVDVITENEVEYLTRCNLSKGRIPEEMNVIMSHFDLKYGVSTTGGDATTPEIIDYSNQIYDFADVVLDAGASVVASTAVFVKRIPTKFINAEYELKCDDGVVDKGCVNELLSRNSSNYGVGANGENKKMLFWPKLLPAGKTLRLQLKFPAVGTDPAASFFFVEARIKGIHLGKRPGA